MTDPTGDERVAIYEDVEDVEDVEGVAGEFGADGLKVVLEACLAIALGETQDDPGSDDADAYRELAESLEGIV